MGSLFRANEIRLIYPGIFFKQCDGGRVFFEFFNYNRSIIIKLKKYEYT